MDAVLIEYLNKLKSEVEVEVRHEEGGRLFHVKVGEVPIRLEAQEGAPLLRAVIAPLPEKRREVLLSYLMRANFLGQGTGGAAIGLDSEEKCLTLSLSLSYDLSYKAFREALEDFVNYVEFWQKEVSRHALEESEL